MKRRRFLHPRMGEMLFLFFLPLAAAAEGSIDINRQEGSRHYRLYLEWFPNSPMQVTALDGVPSTHKIFVYVGNGERLLLASSNLNAVSGNAGAIRYTKPDGTTTVTLTGPGTAGSTGFIDTRAAEKAGPYGLYNGGVGGYTPFDIVSDQTGIWTIEFISQNPTDANGTAGGPRLTTAGWPLNQRRGIAAWDVSVYDGTSLISGRAFAKWLPLNPGGLTASGNFITASPQFYIKTRDGILYRWEQRGYAGYGHSLFSNNSGILNLDLQRMFESIVYQGIPLPSDRRLHSPAYDDNDSLFTNKMFFNIPDANMPQFAQLGAEMNHWLNPVYSTEPATFFYESFPVTHPLEGDFTVVYPTVQGATIVVDCDQDGIYGNNNDRTLRFYTKAGDNTVVRWDGLDGAGAILPSGCYVAQLLIQNGEVHFPMLDIENNFGGIVLERLNGPGTLPDYTVHWNDLPLNNNAEVPAGSYLKATPSQGVSSLDNGHRWGSVAWNGLAATHSNQYGDAKFIDTWSYAITTQNAVIYTACGALNASAPVVLKGSTVNNAHQLRWQLSPDASLREVVIERSTNGANYSAIATRSAASLQYTPTWNTYVHGATPGTTAHYRLRLHYTNNSSRYSTVVQLGSNAPAAALRIIPNPVQDQSVVQFQSETAGRAWLQIVSATGEQVHKELVLLRAGLNTWRLRVMQQLVPAAYFLQLVDERGRVTQTKLLKLH